MYQEQFNLSSKDILEKEFKIDTRGYRLKEVDQFLDLIIGDYEQFFKILKEYDKEKESETGHVFGDHRHRLRRYRYFASVRDEVHCGGQRRHWRRSL